MKFNDYLGDSESITESVDLKTNIDAIVSISVRNADHKKLLNEVAKLGTDVLRYKGEIEQGTKIHLDGDRYICIHNLTKNTYFTIYGKTPNKIMKIASRKGAGSTPVKEIVPLWMFEYNNNKGGIMSPEAMLRKVDQEPKVQKHYDMGYYQLAVNSLKFFKKLGLSSGYIFERPKDKGVNVASSLTDQVYGNRPAGGPAEADNWNPGDVWFFSKKGAKEIKNLPTDSIWEYTNALNILVQSKDVVPLSLKSPLPSPSKLEKIEKDMPFDIKEHPFWRIQISMKPTHLSYMYIRAAKSKDYMVKFFAQTPKVKPELSPGVLNPKYKPNLSYNVQLWRDSANHGAGSLWGKTGWQQEMRQIQGSIKLWRNSGPGCTSLPDVVSKELFNHYRPFYTKYKPGKMSDAKFEDFTPDARKQYIMWGAWMELAMSDYEKFFDASYKFAKGFGAKVFSAYWIIY